MDDIETVTGISVCIEKRDDKTTVVGLILHTQDPDENFVLTMPPDEAMTLSKDLYQAAKAAELGDFANDISNGSDLN